MTAKQRLAKRDKNAYAKALEKKKKSISKGEERERSGMRMFER